MQGSRGGAVAYAQAGCPAGEFEFRRVVGNISGSLRSAPTGTSRGLFSTTTARSASRSARSKTFDYECPRRPADPAFRRPPEPLVARGLSRPGARASGVIAGVLAGFRPRPRRRHGRGHPPQGRKEGQCHRLTRTAIARSLLWGRRLGGQGRLLVRNRLRPRSLVNRPPPPAQTSPPVLTTAAAADTVSITDTAIPDMPTIADTAAQRLARRAGEPGTAAGARRPRPADPAARWRTDRDQPGESWRSTRNWTTRPPSSRKPRTQEPLPLLRPGHEFRTPLGSIRSIVRILLDEMDGHLTTERRNAGPLHPDLRRRAERDGQRPPRPGEDRGRGGSASPPPGSRWWTCSTPSGGCSSHC